MSKIAAKHRCILCHRERLKSNEHRETKNGLTRLHVFPSARQSGSLCGLRRRQGPGSTFLGFQSRRALPEVMTVAVIGIVTQGTFPQVLVAEPLSPGFLKRPNSARIYA
jgi:hypothetical protein